MIFRARTGVAVEILPGFEGQIRARSGLAAKNGIGLVNGIGTIDQDYRGELVVILINHHKSESFVLRRDDRIAQLVIAPVARPELVFVDVFDGGTARGDGGLGSTGT